MVFKRWTKVVLASILPPVGPFRFPMDCSKRQAIEPAFGQLWSEPAGMVVSGVALAHTSLLSTELCQVAFPKATGLGALSLGWTSGLRKWVMIWTGSPKKLTKRVASGRAALTVQEAPVPFGRQT